MCRLRNKPAKNLSPTLQAISRALTALCLAARTLCHAQQWIRTRVVLGVFCRRLAPLFPILYTGDAVTDCCTTFDDILIASNWQHFSLAVDGDLELTIVVNVSVQTDVCVLSLNKCDRYWWTSWMLLNCLFNICVRDCCLYNVMWSTEVTDKWNGITLHVVTWILLHSELLSCHSSCCHCMRRCDISVLLWFRIKAIRHHSDVVFLRFFIT